MINNTAHPEAFPRRNGMEGTKGSFTVSSIAVSVTAVSKTTTHNCADTIVLHDFPHKSRIWHQAFLR